MPQRTSDDFPARVADHGVAGFDPVPIFGLWIGGDPMVVRQVGGDLVAPQDRVDAYDPDPALSGDVLHGRDPAIATGEGRRQPHLHSLGVEVEAGQWHVVLPADQAAEPAESRRHHLQRRPVPLSPDRALRAGRHQLAVLVEQPPVGAEVQRGVVDGGPVRLALLHPDDHMDAVGTSRPLRSCAVAGPGTTTACSTRRAYQGPSPSQIGPASIHNGVPGTNASGNTTSSAPRSAASATSSSTRVSVASRSSSTYAACTAATMNRPFIAFPTARAVRTARRSPRRCRTHHRATSMSAQTCSRSCSGTPDSI